MPYQLPSIKKLLASIKDINEQYKKDNPKNDLIAILNLIQKFLLDSSPNQLTQKNVELLTATLFFCLENTGGKHQRFSPYGDLGKFKPIKKSNNSLRRMLLKALNITEENSLDDLSKLILLKNLYLFTRDDVEYYFQEPTYLSRSELSNSLHSIANDCFSKKASCSVSESELESDKEENEGFFLMADSHPFYDFCRKHNMDESDILQIQHLVGGTIQHILLKIITAPPDESSISNSMINLYENYKKIKIVNQQPLHESDAFFPQLAGAVDAIASIQGQKKIMPNKAYEIKRAMLVYCGYSSLQRSDSILYDLICYALNIDALDKIPVPTQINGLIALKNY